MAQFRFGFDKPLYGVGSYGDPENELGPEWRRKVFETVLGNLVQSVEGGLKGPNLRTMSRILSALDNTPSQDTIEIETAEIELLRTLLKSDKATVPMAQVRYLTLLQDEIDKLQK